MKKYFMTCLIAILALVSNSGRAQEPKELYMNNRPPLVSKPFMELPLGAIRPQGWLKDQMERMAGGMTGLLDSLYPQVMGPRNGWLGGDGDVWERGPYWIDGLLPLAYILNDARLKAKVKPWVEWTLQSQQPDGYFGPSQDRTPEPGLQRTNARDWWPKIVVLKFMMQYYEATKDPRVIPFMTNYFKYQLKELPQFPLNHWTDWAKERGGDNLLAVYWLYNITGDKFLLDLGKILAEQTSDWTDIFLNQDQLTQIFSTHGVNLAQAMKEPAVLFQYTKDRKNLDAITKGAAVLKREHGWPIGLFGADEMLHTGNPTQGSELCTAVEMMYSLENILQITGNPAYADWLERVTFNALPTQVTDNCDSRQYYQQLNQVEVSRHDRNFMTCYNGTGQLFGLLDGYPCCTSNLHQGWPKFTQNLWLATDDRGLAALVYSPSSVDAEVANGVKVHIDENTDYPFEKTVRFRITIPDKNIKMVFFPLHLRVPGWCQQPRIRINGQDWDQPVETESIFEIYRNWKSGDVVELELPMEVTVSRWYEASATIERGPLVYALRIGEKWEKVKDDHKFGDRYGDWYYEVHPTSPWNYCLQEKDIDPAAISKAFVVVEKKLNGYPWNLENAPVEIKAKGKRMNEWQMYNGSAGPLPYSVQYQLPNTNEEDITLIPYGCTTLRITEFPVTSK